jgi:hypothetical protein
MRAAPRNWLMCLLVIGSIVAGSAGAARAGWVTIRNDTNRVLVVQCGTTTGGQTKRCKPIRLLPGESAREFHTPSSVTFEVFEGQSPNNLLHTSTQDIKAANQTYSVGFSGQSVMVAPAQRR